MTFISQSDIIQNCYYYGSKWGADPLYQFENQSATLFPSRSFTSCIMENQVLYMNSFIMKSMIFLIVLMTLKIIIDNWVVPYLYHKIGDDYAKLPFVKMNIFELLLDVCNNFYLLVYVYAVCIVVWYWLLFWR